MKIWKRVIALAIGITAGLSVSACKPNDGFNIDENPEDVTSITILSSDLERFNEARRADTPIYQALKAAVGVDIMADSVSGEMLDRSIELRRADGSLPEMFRIAGPMSTNQYSGLIKEDEILPISDYVNEQTKNKYPNLYKHLAKFEYMKHNVEYAQGKLWFCPIEWACEKSFCIRVDWIENLNKTEKLTEILVRDGVVSKRSEVTPALLEQYKYVIPETLPEFYRLARAFTLYDPDGNGRDDTRGYVTSQDRGWDSWLAIACDTGSNQFVDDGTGTYVHTNTTDGTKQATAMLMKMMNEGYMAPDSLTFTIGDQYRYFHPGKAGMMFAHNWENYFLRDIMAAQGVNKAKAETMIKLVDPPKGLHGAYGGAGAENYYRGLAINANMSKARIEKCLEILEFLYSEQGMQLMCWGVEGVHWKTDEATGEKISLRQPDKDGFIWSVREYDNAEILSEVFRVEYLPTNAQALHSNGDILTARAAASAAYGHMSDYPEVYTQSFIQYHDAANDFFKTSILKMYNDAMTNKSLVGDWTFNAKTWATDGWDKLFTTSQTFETRWAAYVNTYNTTYHGTQMQQEFNAYIQSGKAMKYTQQ